MLCKYEYCKRHKNANDFKSPIDQEDFLNFMGKESWELCAVTAHPFRDGVGIATWDFYFKRVTHVWGKGKWVKN